MVLREFYNKSSDRTELCKVVLKEGSNLPDVVKLIGTSATMSFIAIMIQNFCRQFNVRSNMTSGQIMDLAADLTLDFANRKGNQVRLEELAVFFDRAGKNEFTKRNGTSFVFDRIDRGVIEEMLDVYFETDRTQAVWAIEDEKRIQAAGPIVPRTTEPIQLDKFGNDITPKNIYDLAGTKAFPMAKMMQELEKKYGGGNEEK